MPAPERQGQWVEITLQLDPAGLDYYAAQEIAWRLATDLRGAADEEVDGAHEVTFSMRGREWEQLGWLSLPWSLRQEFPGG